MSGNKRFASAAEQNKADILGALRPELTDGDLVLEIGSGTGQHICYFAPLTPSVEWQPTELSQNLPDVAAWIAESGSTNIRPPILLDINADPWPIPEASICYSANTLHIISEIEVKRFFEGCSKVLSTGGKLCVYGPYKFSGKHVSGSNEQFDQMLRFSDPLSGIRDVTMLDEMANVNGFQSARVIPLPVNNCLLVWERE